MLYNIGKINCLGYIVFYTANQITLFTLFATSIVLLAEQAICINHLMCRRKQTVTINGHVRLWKFFIVRTHISFDNGILQTKNKIT